MKKICICCGKPRNELPYVGRGIYFGYMLCKSCGQAQGAPLEEENSTLDKTEGSEYNREN